MEVEFTKPSGFKRLPPHKQLDDILKKLDSTHYKEHIITYLALKFMISERDMKIIFNKLEKDGYVSRDKDLSDGLVVTYHSEGKHESVVVNEETDVYYLTFEGLVLLENNGYTGKFERDSIENKNKSNIDLINRRLGNFNYETRKVPIYVSLAALILTFGFGVNSSVNERSNKAEVEKLNTEIQALKNSISICSHTKNGN